MTNLDATWLLQRSKTSHSPNVEETNIGPGKFGSDMIQDSCIMSEHHQFTLLSDHTCLKVVPVSERSQLTVIRGKFTWTWLSEFRSICVNPYLFKYIYLTILSLDTILEQTHGVKHAHWMIQRESISATLKTNFDGPGPGWPCTLYFRHAWWLGLATAGNQTEGGGGTTLWYIRYCRRPHSSYWRGGSDGRRWNAAIHFPASPLVTYSTIPVLKNSWALSIDQPFEVWTLNSNCMSFLT